LLTRAEKKVDVLHDEVHPAINPDTIDDRRRPRGTQLSIGILTINDRSDLLTAQFVIVTAD
jgi:hypothetical protein